MNDMSTTRLTSGENQLIRRPAKTARTNPLRVWPGVPDAPPTTCFARNASALQTIDTTISASPIQMSAAFPLPSTK